MAGYTGKGTRSYRKEYVSDSSLPALGFKRFEFAFVGILDNGTNVAQTDPTLEFLTVSGNVPTDLSTRGFNQPSSAEIGNAQLGEFRNNVTVTSNLNGTLMDRVAYTITDTSITFIQGYTVEPGEFFIISRGQEAVTGNRIVDARPLRATASLDFSNIATSVVDFRIPAGFRVAPSLVSSNGDDDRQIGFVQVFVDGVLQFRNAGNANEDATAAANQTGNYRELFLDAAGTEVVVASGVIANAIRFNIGQPFSTNEAVMVISTNLIVDSPNNTGLSDQVEAISSVVLRKELFNIQVTGDFGILDPLAFPVPGGTTRDPTSDIISIGMDRATEPVSINGFQVTITNEFDATPVGTLTLLLQISDTGIGDDDTATDPTNGWTTIGTATSTAGAPPTISLTTTSIVAGAYVRLRPTSFGTTQPSFHVAVNSTVEG